MAKRSASVSAPARGGLYPPEDGGVSSDRGGQKLSVILTSAAASKRSVYVQVTRIKVVRSTHFVA